MEEPPPSDSSISRENVECQLFSMSSFGVIGTLAAGFALSNIYDTEPNTTLSRLVLITSVLCVCMNMSANQTRNLPRSHSVSSLY
ncbi:hypothetical protein TrST_g7781 [Triparma strigata]|uniref:Uncharacterized protein n=1 Tax=Triparma strigata TaxID=1606541 RepID=A0A9W7BLH7_9STRA|nr:hypothetical protein TrST_g7781 [Triparma strigata]